MKKHLTILKFTTIFTLLASSCAFANVGAMAEGGYIYFIAYHLVVIGVFLIDPAAYRKFFSWGVAVFFYLYFGGFYGPFSQIPVFIALIYFIVKSIQLLSSEASEISKKLRISFVVIAICLFGFSVHFGNESRIGWYYYMSHNELSGIVKETAKKIEEGKNNSKDGLYPDSVEFKGKIYPEAEEFRSVEYSKTEPATLKYEPSKDRKKFVLSYSGNYFRQNPWYILPPGYPLYRSYNGLKPGERLPYLDGCFVVNKRK